MLCSTKCLPSSHRTTCWTITNLYSKVAIQLKPALISVTEVLRSARAESKSSVLILLDLAAAFDTVNHPILLSTLSTELLIFRGTPSVQHQFTIQLGPSTIIPSVSVRNLGVILDDQLTFKDHIAKTAYAGELHNIRKIRPFLTEHATQLLVQALVISRRDYYNALLAGLPTCAIRPLQMIKNAAACLVFNEPKRAHVTHRFSSLYTGYQSRLASSSSHWCLPT